MKKIFKKIILLTSALFLIASFSYAATFSDLAISLSNGLIATVSKLAFAFAFVFLFWGIFTFVLNLDDPGKMEEGKKKIIFSIVAIFVMLSVWGILSFVTGSVSLENNKHIQIHLDGSRTTTYSDINSESNNSQDGNINYGGSGNHFNDDQDIRGGDRWYGI